MKNTPLIDEAIRRCEDQLSNTAHGSPAHMALMTKIERHRHEKTIAILDELARPKKIEKFISIVTLLAAILVAVGLYFQVRQFYENRLGLTASPENVIHQKQPEAIQSGQEQKESKASSLSLSNPSIIPPKNTNRNKAQPITTADPVNVGGVTGKSSGRVR
jgi:hypothetical protein